MEQTYAQTVYVKGKGYSLKYTLAPDERYYICEGFDEKPKSFVSVEIGSKINELDVIIGARAFQNQYLIKWLYLGTNIITIEEGAFANCGYISEIHYYTPSMSDIDINRDDGELEIFYNGLASYAELYVYNNVTRLPGQLFASTGGNNASLSKIVFKANSECADIGNRCFLGNRNLIEIEIEGNNEYFDCLPKSIENLHAHCFRKTGLRTISVEEGSSLKVINASSFRESELNEVDLKYATNLTDIGTGVFADCSKLQSVSLGAGDITFQMGNSDDPNFPDVAPHPFYNTPQLTNISIYLASQSSILNKFADNQSDAPWGANPYTFIKLYIKDELKFWKVCGDPDIEHVTFNSKTYITSLPKKDILIIPSHTCRYYKEYPIVGFKESLLETNDLAGLVYVHTYQENTKIKKAISAQAITTTLYIPNSVETFSNILKEKAQLLIINLPDSYTNIESEMAQDCTKLITVNLSKQTKTIGARAFYNCQNITTFSVPDTLESIGEEAFYNNSVNKLDLSKTKITDIDVGTFKKCKKLQSIELPENTLTKICAQAFKECESLESIDFPQSLTTIGEETFYGCVSIQKIQFKDSIETIGARAFYNCQNITTFFVPNKVTVINQQLLEGCIQLQNIELHENIISISKEAFKDCKILKSAWIRKSTDFVGKSVFENCNNIILYCEAEKKPEQWSEDWNISNRPVYWDVSAFGEEQGFNWIQSKNKKHIASYTGNEVEIWIPEQIDEVEVIGIHEKAFQNNTTIQNVIIPNSILQIGDYAFANCVALKKLWIGDRIITVNNTIFQDCTNLETICLGQRIIDFPINYDLANYEKLREIMVHQDNESYSSKRGLLYNKDGNELLVYPQAKEETEFKLPPGLVSIKPQVAKNARFLNALYIPASVTQIGEGAFSNESLKYVYLYGEASFGEAPEVSRYILRNREAENQVNIERLSEQLIVSQKLGDTDFLGFTFNGTHSLYDLGVIRTINSRINDTISPQITDKTATDDAQDGDLYFGTVNKIKTFTIDFAFDNLSEVSLRRLRTFCAYKQESDLIFDECPYKAYTAKITGTPTLKYLAFDDVGSGTLKRIYKGEGSIQFTCYYPYAHTLNSSTKRYVKNLMLDGNSEDEKDYYFVGQNLDYFLDASYPTKDQWAASSQLTTNTGTHTGENPGQLPAPFVLSRLGKVDKNSVFKVGNFQIKVLEDCYHLEWNSKLGIVSGCKTETGVRQLIAYSGNSYGTIPVGGIQSDDITLNGATLHYDYWYY